MTDLSYWGMFMDAGAGAHIRDVAEQAVQVARSHRVNVAFEFNGTLVRVWPHSTPEEVIADWVKARAAKWPELS